MSGSDRARAEFAANNERRAGFRALAQATRRVLTDIYQENDPKAPENKEKSALKNIAMKNFREQYATLRASWVVASGFAPELAGRQLAGYDTWVANANNAALGALAAYDDLVPDFEALFDRFANEPGGPWAGFYDAVKRLAKLTVAERKVQLKVEIQKRTEKKGG